MSGKIEMHLRQQACHKMGYICNSPAIRTVRELWQGNDYLKIRLDDDNN